MANRLFQQYSKVCRELPSSAIFNCVLLTAACPSDSGKCEIAHREPPFFNVLHMAQFKNKTHVVLYKTLFNYNKDTV